MYLFVSFFIYSMTYMITYMCIYKYVFHTHYMYIYILFCILHVFLNSMYRSGPPVGIMCDYADTCKSKLVSWFLVVHAMTRICYFYWSKNGARTRFSSNMCRWNYLGIHIPNAPYFGLQTPNLGDEKAFPEWTQELVVLQLHPLKRTLGGQETMLTAASGKLGMVPLSNMKLHSQFAKIASVASDFIRISQWRCCPGAQDLRMDHCP